ncbi:MAG: hypothetical protein FWD26_10395 [Treponema sp.]|nr:hypothetical protein [Treponema sp.]
MRKSLATRIIGLAVLYCMVFFFVVILQFSNKGNFSLSAGAMTIRGRYSQTEAAVTGEASITGGVKIFYGGLDFNLKEERGKGLMLTGPDGTFPVNPEFLTLTENPGADSTVKLTLPGGTEIIFNSSDSPRGPELQINAVFAGNVSEVAIPIVPRRSSLVRDNGQIGIVFGGARYFFSSAGLELQEGKIILSNNNSLISYRQRDRQRVFNPSDFIIANAQNYETVLRNWQDAGFAYWNQNILQNEEDIIAYLAEALRRGSYPAALNSIPNNFISSPRQSYKSSAFAGGMANAHRTFVAMHNEKTSQITRAVRERSLVFLREEHLLDYLLSRGSSALAGDVIEAVKNAEPQMLTIDYCAGLLEFFTDARRWQLNTNDANYPIGHLKDQIFQLVSDNLNRDSEKDAVYISAADGISSEYSLRLGKALVSWAQTAQGAEAAEWTAIGRSLILSALAGSNSGRFYNLLNPTQPGFSNYYPRATLLSDTGHWIWTASPTVRSSFIDGNVNITFSFPPNTAHYVIVSGVRPFIKIQIHGMDWRTDNQFERYDSSGWVYYPQDQLLVVKLRHRATVENIRIFYRLPPAAVTTPAETRTTEAPEVEAVE